MGLGSKEVGNSLLWFSVRLALRSSGVGGGDRPGVAACGDADALTVGGEEVRDLVFGCLGVYRKVEQFYLFAHGVLAFWGCVVEQIFKRGAQAPGDLG